MPYGYMDPQGSVCRVMYVAHEKVDVATWNMPRRQSRSSTNHSVLAAFVEL